MRNFVCLVVLVALTTADEYAQNYLTEFDLEELYGLCQNNTKTLATFSPCGGYIEGRESFTANSAPQVMPCGNQFGDSWAPDYQLGSCCSGDGAYFVMTGQMGGFDTSWETGDPTPRCTGYATALQSLLCSPYQGDFIDGDGDLLICESSCDAVFDNCGLPGVNFPSFASYSDGASLCTELWGGFGSTPCGGRPDGWPCQASVGIKVVNGIPGDSCLGVVRPNFDLSNEDWSDGYCAKRDPTIANDPCADILWARDNGNGASNSTKSLWNQLFNKNSDDDCVIPAYARDEESRKVYSKKCSGAGVYVSPLLGVAVLLLAWKS